MLQTSTSRIVVKHYSEPVGLTLVLIPGQEEHRSLLSRMVCVILEKIAQKLMNLEPSPDTDGLQKLQQEKWIERYYVLGSSLRASLPKTHESVLQIEPVETTCYLAATLSFSIPDLAFQQSFSIGIAREIVLAQMIHNWEKIAQEIFELLMHALRVEIKSEVRNKEVHLSNLMDYTPSSAQMRGNYLKTVLQLNNVLAALKLTLQL